MALCAAIAGGAAVMSMGAAGPGVGLGRASIEIAPGRVIAGAWTTVRVRIRAGNRPLRGARVTVGVPAGWARPSMSPASAGGVTASAGRVVVRGRAVAVRRVNLAAGAALTIAYGTRRGGATAPTSVGVYRFSVTIAEPGSRGEVKVQRRLSVRVAPPAFGCRREIDPSGPGGRLLLPDGVAQANLHNTASATGSVSTCFGAAGVTTSLHLRNIRAIAPGPAGYPEVAYGYHLLDQPFCASCHTWPFPMPVSRLLRGPADDRLTTAYSLGVPSPSTLPVDFIYDLWLERHPSPGVAPQPGDVEVIIFLYHRGMTTCTHSPFARTVSVAFWSNGRAVRSRWIACHLPGGTRATPIAFFPQSHAAGRTGQISLRLRDFISAAGDAVGIDLRHHWLLGIELGGEFDQCSLPAGCVAKAAGWRWRISRLTFDRATGSVPIVFSVR